MGFAILILIIIIIAVVFFAFSIRKSTTQVEPKLAEMDDFIQATMSYTTDCKIYMEAQNIRNLIKECNSNAEKQCENDETHSTVCEKLNSTLQNILYNLLGENISNQYIHGYVLSVNSSQPITIEKGNLTGNYFASSTAIPVVDGSEIIVKLKFYYSKNY